MCNKRMAFLGSSRILVIGAALMVVLNFQMAKADYVSKALVGNFEDVSSWNARGYAPAYPSSDGMITGDRLIINGTITRNGDLTSVEATVNGILIINGNYTNSGWGGLTVKSGAKVEIFGNLTGSAAIAVDAGGLLIVHGNLTSSGASVSIKGNAIVKGNYSTSSNTQVNVNGNLVVGGDFSHSGGALSVTSSNLYILDPNAVITHPGWGDLKSGNYGDNEDFLDKESGNNALYDQVVNMGLVTVVYTWVGKTSSDWFDVRNWKDGKLPTSGTSVVINTATNSPVVREGGLAEVKNIEMSAGSALTLEPGARMTVSGNIVNAGATVLLKNTVSKPTSFLTKGTVAAPVTVQWTYSNGRYFYVAHSVDGVTYNAYDAPTANAFNLYRYTGSAWGAITSSAGLSGIESVLEGYSVKFNETGNPVLVYTGTLRSGNYSRPINGWNLIANPYPAYLDLESTGINYGNSLSSVWTTTNASGSTVYSTYNTASKIGAGGGTRYVAPGQSFWVRNYSASSITVSSTARAHSTGMLKSASAAEDVLRINLIGEKGTDEVVLAFRESGSNIYSDVYDSEKRFAAGVAEVAVYSLKGDKKLVINVLPVDLIERTVPLGINIGTQADGVYRLCASNIQEFMPGIDVGLLDKVTGESLSLREKPEYTFTATPGSGQDRFELIFKTAEKAPEVPTGIGSNEASGIVITAIGIGNKAVVKVSDLAFDGNVRIELIDSMGKVQLSGTYTDARTVLEVPTSSPFYLVRVSYRGMVKTFKIMTTRAIDLR